MHRDWGTFLAIEREKPYFRELTAFVAHERANHVVHPPDAMVFRALEATPLATTKVVVLGQDPYHGAGQANGLAFSVDRDVTMPPSLRNILRELHDDTGLPLPGHGDLRPWAEQGVLLLNTTLTVRDGEAASHSGHGWESFTDAVIRTLDARTERTVFLLWGTSSRVRTPRRSPHGGVSSVRDRSPAPTTSSRRPGENPSTGHCPRPRKGD
ncbi:MAG: hypothetical protein RJA51_389 [Actinomycetota bacterium]